ncbi:hypothetical protein N0V88_006210 [Collariella sp. IMI 366227]|nr:hypothetical protein N0V88_006210 [Collariella sp. IMI 366227]
MKRSDKLRFDALLEWSQSHGAELHPSLEIYDDDLTKFSLRVKPTIIDEVEGEFTAVTCPVSTTLSYLNALVDGPINPSTPFQQNNPAFPARFMQSIPPHVVGRFFLIKEYLKGKASFWHPYITALPQPEHVNSWALPAFWPEDDIAYLEGTNAYVAIEEIQANVKREFKQARKALKEDDFPDWQDYTQMLYKWAFCIFTSRSFRPSLVLSTPSIQHLTPLLPSTCQIDDFSILQPLFDIANHSMTAMYSWDITTSPTACRLISRDTYAPGQQVFNNYGRNKTNSELLLAYGFILPESRDLHNDYVHVRKRQQQPPQQNSDPEKPLDFLISLRPLSVWSSLAGRCRLSLGPTSRLASLPCFTHFEPALVDDLASAVAATIPGQAEALERWAMSNDDPAHSRGPPEDVREMVEQG